MIRITQAHVQYAAALKSDIRLSQSAMLVLSDQRAAIRVSQAFLLYAYVEVQPVNLTQAPVLVAFREVPPNFTSADTHEASTWADTEYAITVDDPTGVTFTLEGFVPPGVTLDGSTIHFTAQEAGSYVLRIRARRYTVAYSELILLVNVSAAPVFLPPPPISGVAGQPLTFTLQAVDPEEEPITFTLVSGTALSRVTIGGVTGPSGSGVYSVLIGGNFPAAGTYTLTVRADTPSGGSATQAVNIVIAAAPELPIPEITIIGDNPVVIPQYSTYVDLGATASLDGVDISAELEIEGLDELDTSIPLSYNITYRIPANEVHAEAIAIRNVLIDTELAISCMATRTLPMIDVNVVEDIQSPSLGSTSTLDFCLIENAIANSMI